MEVALEEKAEVLHDELEAYPLRLNVAALPERRFFKMTRMLTVSVVLLSALLITLGVYLNYQITHLDVTVRKNNIWQFYRIDPEEKRLKAAESASISVDPLKLVVEEKLRDYLTVRNSTVWAMDVMDRNLGPSGLIAQVSHPSVYNKFITEGRAMLNKTRGAELVRDVHIYELKWIRSNLWMAIIETFDLPMSDDQVSVCLCSDNSKGCIRCKIAHAKNRERRKIWMRTSFNRPKRCEADIGLCENPLGISVDKYISTFVPIHDEATYWDLPPALRPEI